MQRILITGTGGFIFGNFVRRAIYTKAPYEFVSLDHCHGPNVLNNIYFNKSHQFHIADIRDKHIMNVIFGYVKPDIVIHGAASTFVDDAIHDADPFVSSNVLGTQNLIDVSVKHKVKKFIFTSTDEVYGQLTSENDSAWKEDASLNPRNPYSASKLAGEALVRAAHQTHGLNYNIIRPCNNYGPRQHERNFIPKIIKSILNNQEMPIYGKGLQCREWMHTEDTYSAILAVIEKGINNETYNISTGHEYRNIEVFNEICNLFERGHQLAKFVNDRPGHDWRYASDSQKLRKLGWAPTWKFKRGLQYTCDWYKTNQQWFRNKESK